MTAQDSICTSIRNFYVLDLWFVPFFHLRFLACELDYLAWHFMGIIKGHCGQNKIACSVLF